MRRGTWAPLFCLALATITVPVLAQPRTGAAAGDVSAEDQAKAQHHFQRAKELYQAGSYREAAAELEIARKLDPKAKDLVMNLGIVNEKLGKFDEALAHFRTYLVMDGVTAAERAKVEAIMKRIEGAKREVPAPTASTTPSATPASSSSSTAPSTSASSTTPETPPENGRIDALTIVAGSLAVIGLAGGTALGVYAMTSRPDEGFVTGRDGTYADLVDKTDSAHTTAIIADISIGVGVVAAVATLWLYFGRTKEPAKSGFVNPTPKVSVLPGYVGGTF